MSSVHYIRKTIKYMYTHWQCIIFMMIVYQTKLVHTKRRKMILWKMYTFKVWPNYDNHDNGLKVQHWLIMKIYENSFSPWSNYIIKRGKNKTLHPNDMLLQCATKIYLLVITENIVPTIFATDFFRTPQLQYSWHIYKSSSFGKLIDHNVCWFG